MCIECARLVDEVAERTGLSEGDVAGMLGEVTCWPLGYPWEIREQMLEAFDLHPWPKWRLGGGVTAGR